MEEPNAPTWASDSPAVLSAWAPPLDADASFPEEVSRSLTVALLCLPTFVSVCLPIFVSVCLSVSVSLCLSLCVVLPRSSLRALSSLSVRQTRYAVPDGWSRPGGIQLDEW